MSETTAAIIGALVGAVVGAAATYVGTWHIAARDRQRQRAAIATALLAELRDMDTTVRQVYATDTPTGTIAPNAFALLSQVYSHVTLFEPGTIGVLLDIRDDVLQIRGALDDFGAQPSPANRHLVTFARISAWAAAQKVPAAQRALEDAGGLLPDRLRLDFDRLTPEFPPLPPSVFARRQPRRANPRGPG